MIVAIIALVAALSGSAIAAKKAALPKNSVGTKQLKNKSVTTGKIANNAVTGAKVANESLTNEDIKVSQLATVPSAERADSASDSEKISTHPANCPSGTTLVRGTCYDVTLSPPGPGASVSGVKAAATACANKGGYLPTPMELYSVRTVVNLGDGTPPNYAVSDQYYADNFNYKTITVDGSGTMAELEINGSTKYICAYALVR
jgi:hypothetical protein